MGSVGVQARAMIEAALKRKEKVVTYSNTKKFIALYLVPASVMAD